MKTLVAEYSYENKCTVKIFTNDKEPDIPEEDVFILELTTCEGNLISFGFRPDEGLLLISLIATAINRTLSSYEIEVEPKIYEIT